MKRSQARLKPFNLQSLKHKYVAKMPSGYLNHPLPVSVLSLSVLERDQKCFIPLALLSSFKKDLYCRGSDFKKEKRRIFGMSDSECFGPFEQNHTSLLPVGKGNRV